MLCCSALRGGPCGHAGIGIQDVRGSRGRTGTRRRCVRERRQSWRGISLVNVISCQTIGKVLTFAMRARNRDRTRNLNLSSSVWTMTSLKFAVGSAVAFMSSMTSIWCTSVSMRPVYLTEASTYLSGHPRHRPIYQLGRVWQQLWRRALVDPCSRESLQVKSLWVY
jgi:hypothetical protein